MYLAFITFSSTTLHAVIVPNFGRNPCCHLGSMWLYLVIKNHVIRVRWILQTGDGTPSGRSFPLALGIHILVKASSWLQVLAIFMDPKTQDITR
jgi:hypothetical protein